jgi:hypothetical protein
MAVRIIAVTVRCTLVDRLGHGIMIVFQLNVGTVIFRTCARWYDG